MTAVRARRLARALVQDGTTVVSSLAAGIDTEAHTAAIDGGGQTIAVIGTPLGEVYPSGGENPTEVDFDAGEVGRER